METALVPLVNKTDYDDDFLKIAHYRSRPEMLPFVGNNYGTHGILLVTESHYFPQNVNEEELNRVSDNWYEPQVLCKCISGNIHTRGVILNVNKNKGHRVFLNMQSALSEVGLHFNDVAWYNFFQKPASYKSGFRPDRTGTDIARSQEVFEDLLNILQPKLVVFASKLAFGALQKSNGKTARVWDKELKAHRFKEHSFPIQVTAHPNSVSWYAKCYKTPDGSKISGREKFVRILKAKRVKVLS